jgi:arylsulfatase
LGLDLEWTVGEIREDLLVQVKQSLTAGGAAMGSLSGGMSKRDYLDYEVRSSLSEGERFDLIAMGRSEGPGCYCAVNHNLREVIDSISKSYRYAVIDNEAGMEHLSRRTTRDVHHLIVVSDPTQRGLVAAERIAGFRNELDIHIENTYLILNRLNGEMPAPLRERVEQMDIPLLGVVPADAELTARPDEIPAWDEMPEELKPVLARQMEIYAGFLEHTDAQVGRLIDVLEDLEILDDTLVYYIIGDNGASAEGTINGTFNEMISLNGAGALETAEFMASKIDLFGTPQAYNHYAVGWAHAMNTPYQWTKQVASHWGGTRNGTILHWPKGFEARGEVRSQFTHVIDIAATVLEAAGLPEPAIVNSVQQMPLHGQSMLDTFDDSTAPELRETQYFEMFVNRGIYHKGWTAVTRHSTPWILVQENPPYDEDVWELYAPDDWTQAHDLSKEMPEKLSELQRLFLIEAARYNVLPLDDRRAERFNADLAGRPQLLQGNTQLLFGGMGRLTENSVLVIKNKSHAVSAQIVVPKSGANGVIIAQGGAFGGWSLYAKDGKPVYCYNLFGLQQFKVEGQQVVPPGEHQVRMEFDYDGGGLGKGGAVTLYLDGKNIGQGRVEATEPMIFSGDETTDVGGDSATPVSDDYGPKDSEFTGQVIWVQIDIDEAAEDLDHLITAEERLRMAMARK